MAEENKEESGGSPDEFMEELQQRAAKQLKLLLGVGLSSIAFAALLGFAYVSLSGNIVRVSQEPLMEMTNLAGLVSEEYANLNLALEFHNLQLETLSRRIDDIGPNIDQAQFDAVQNALRSQEDDFVIFLEALREAVYGLSEMVSGPRGWRDEFSEKLDTAIASSQQRMERSDSGPENMSSKADSDLGPTAVAASDN